MKTLVELYDERPVENTLGAETFRPERVVYICPKRVANDKSVLPALKKFFRSRGIDCKIIFAPARMNSTDEVLNQLCAVVSHYPDCAIDISGGTDAALFAAGMLCSTNSTIPIITWSRRNNCFYNIRNAKFADALPCTITYSVEDCFLMTGGEMKKGRVDNSCLKHYMDIIDPFFEVYLRYRSDWQKIVTYFQRVSQCEKGTEAPLEVSGDYTVKGERGTRIDADEEALSALEDIGLISGLKIDRGSSVSFKFKDRQIRSWLRDVGSVLELYIYKVCLDIGIFNDVVTSAVVDWAGDEESNPVSNELDVVATKGIKPLFISCKTCDIKTEALNELAILRDRFGGQMATAAIVSAEKANASVRHRAAKLNIEVIDIDDLLEGNIEEHIKMLMT